MPLKFNGNRPKRFRAQYQIRNWPQYDRGLRQRGKLTLWVDEAAISGWAALRRATPGGQARYSDLAIELVLMLRLVFHLALRQAEGFVSGTFRLLGLVATRRRKIAVAVVHQDLEGIWAEVEFERMMTT
jgi:hypothetical protein